MTDAGVNGKLKLGVFRVDTRTALSVLIVVTVSCLIFALFTHMIPMDAKDLINVILGAILAKFNTVFDYYFGSSKGSSEKSGVIADALKDANANVQS